MGESQRVTSEKGLECTCKDEETEREIDGGLEFSSQTCRGGCVLSVRKETSV